MGNSAWAYWAGALSDRLDPPNVDFVTSGTADIEFVLDPSLPGTTGGEDRTNGIGKGQIAINPTKLSDPDYLENLFGHELGHALGYADVNCGSSDSKMSGFVSQSGPFPGSATCADNAAVDRDYRRDESPIIIDLDDDGFRLTSPNGGAVFDVTGTGRLRQYSWPVSGADGFLALDRNSNGVIDNGNELFGNWTYLQSGQLADNGYQALAELDGDTNGVLDRRDPMFPTILVWRDFDVDGYSSPAELFRLRQLDISSISLQYRESRRVDRWGNAFKLYSRLVRNQQRLWTSDVFLVSAPCAEGRASATQAAGR